MLTTEADVQAGIKALARALGFFVTDMSQGYRPGGKRHGTTRQTPGIPDLYLMHAGKKLRAWVEVKRPSGKLSEHQKAWHEYAARSGANVWTCDSVESFARHLDPYGWEIVL